MDKLPAEDRLRFYELTKMQRLLDLCGTLRAAAGGNTDQLRKAEQAEQQYGEGTQRIALRIRHAPDGQFVVS